MMNNRKQREGIRKLPPDYVGEKLKRVCREQSVVAADEQVIDLELSDGRDSKEIWGGPASSVWPRKRGRCRGNAAR